MIFFKILEGKVIQTQITTFSLTFFECMLYLKITYSVIIALEDTSKSSQKMNQVILKASLTNMTSQLENGIAFSYSILVILLRRFCEDLIVYTISIVTMLFDPGRRTE